MAVDLTQLSPIKLNLANSILPLLVTIPDTISPTSVYVNTDAVTAISLYVDTAVINTIPLMTSMPFIPPSGLAIMASIPFTPPSGLTIM